MSLATWMERRRLERELREEMRVHREMLEEECRAAGMPADEARRAAAHRLGNTTVFLEQSRDEWSFAWLEALLKDLRFAGRLLRRKPLATAVAAATIALGVGANTAVVSVIRTVLVNPAGLRHAGNVVAARVHVDKLNMRDANVSGAEFRDLVSMPDAFAAVAATENRAWTSQSGGEPARLLGQAVTPEFFTVFGERPALGRAFVADDQYVAILSDRLWHSRFAADPAVLGRVMDLDGKPHRVIGVAPPEFRFPVTAQVWVPLILSPKRLAGRGNNMNLDLFACLKEGVSIEQASGRVNRYFAALNNPEVHSLGYGLDLAPFSRFVAGDLRRPLWLLWAAAWLLLGTACANIALLLASRASARRREIAVRLAVGAAPWQIARQLVVESGLLGLVGGVGGVLLAWLSVSLLSRISLPHKALLNLVAMDYRLLGYGVLLAVASGVFCGLLPALQLLRKDLIRPRRRWFQGAFVTAQACGAFLLVAVTVLLGRSLWLVQRIQPGFDAGNLTTAELIKPAGDPGFVTRLQESLRGVPGVESAALTMPVPFSGASFSSRFQIRNRQRGAGEPEWHGEAYMVTPDYFRTLRIPLLRGRYLADGDAHVCLIDLRMAERFFPGQDPIGQEISMYDGWSRIVGMVGTIRATTLEEGSRPVVYYLLSRVSAIPHAAVVVRSTRPAAASIREAVRRANGSVPMFDVKTMDERIAETLGIRRVMALLVAVFGAIGMLLAALGIYGVAAQAVAERTREIGIRMALGARAGQILVRFMRYGVLCGVAGTVLGLVVLSAAGNWLAGLLYHVDPFDPVICGAAGAGVLAVLCAAVAWPARRAAHIDPQRALRYE